MKSLSTIGLCLSIVFGCLMLAFVAELYYLLWWKRRLTNKDISDDYSSPVRELFFMFCLKKPSSYRHSQELCSSVGIADNNSNSGRDLLVVKPFDDDVVDDDTELMNRIQAISGPPRFLFTIIEETKEDMESELDGRGGSAAIGRGRLSDLLLTMEETTTPFLTPLASPPFFTPPLTPMGYNYFESSADADFNKIVRSSSPPPKFKFLQDAEEKLVRRSRTAGDESGCYDHKDHLKDEEEEEDGPFITIIVDKQREIRELNHHQQHNSKVIPLASPASTDIKKIPSFSRA